MMIEDMLATNMLRGLQEALAMLEEEGLPNVFARHARHGAATRGAVHLLGTGGGLEVQCLEPSDYALGTIRANVTVLREGRLSHHGRGGHPAGTRPAKVSAALVDRNDLTKRCQYARNRRFSSSKG
jgi:hypothetical protein